jgi:hypothetical protein
MDGSGHTKKKQRTLAAQPAAAAHVGAHATVAVGLHGLAAAQRSDSGGGMQRTRLERILLAARQMQQH